MAAPTPEPEFDRFARDYDRVLAGSLAGTTDDGERFAEYKVGEMALQLAGQVPQRILDFGCGVGRSLRFLRQYFPRASIHGYDPSPASLEQARLRLPDASLVNDPALLPAHGFDAILVANVMHHVPPVERPGAVATCASALAAHGSLFVFEHNPLNPVTRRVFDRCPFDEGAVMLPRPELLSLGSGAGLKVVRSAYTLFLPFSNPAWLRAQRLLSWLPAGAQYYVQFAR